MDMPMFVTVEGIDGTGKSSVCEMVHSMLVAEGFRVKSTREPSDSWLGQIVKGSFDKDISPFSEALLFCADRAEHTREIRGWIGKGTHVICDRYVDSTVAYQGAVLRRHYDGKDLLGWLKALNDPFIIEPDMTVLLVASPEVCLERLGARDERTKFERLETLRAVEENYLKLKDGSARFVTVDAEEPLDRVVSRTFELIKDLFLKD
jgi:dTMP kinase